MPLMHPVYRYLGGDRWRRVPAPRNRRERRKAIPYSLSYLKPEEVAKALGMTVAKVKQVHRGKMKAAGRLYRAMYPDIYTAFAGRLYTQTEVRQFKGDRIPIPRRAGWVNPHLGAPYGGRLVENTHQARSYEELSVRTVQALTTGLGLLYEEVASNTMAVAVSRLREDAMLKALRASLTTLGAAVQKVGRNSLLYRAPMRGWPEESPGGTHGPHGARGLREESLTNSTEGDSK